MLTYFLGYYLIEKGIITEEQFRVAAEKLEKGKVRLGTLAVQEKLLTEGKEPVDLYGSAQLFDNVARGARETAGETLLGEDDRWKYDLAVSKQMI